MRGEIVRVERGLKSQIDDWQVLGVLLHVNVAGVDDRPCREGTNSTSPSHPGQSVFLATEPASVLPMPQNSQVGRKRKPTLIDISVPAGPSPCRRVRWRFRPVGNSPRALVRPASCLQATTGPIEEQPISDSGSTKVE